MSAHIETQKSDCLETALAWARSGRPVLPVSRAKTPLTPRGFYDASTDPSAINRWWSTWPTANVAVRTGEPSGLVVLDIDGSAGFESLRQLEEQHGQIPATALATTPRRGLHYYFRWPADVEIKSTVGQVAEGVDTRGAGGYVLISPSATSVGAYEWLERRDIADMPTWLIELTRADRVELSLTPSAADTGWPELLRGGMEETTRNVQLTKLVGHYFGHGLRGAEVMELALLVNESRCFPPLPPKHVRQIVNSIWRRELRRLSEARR